MKLLNLLTSSLSVLLMAPLSDASPVPEAETQQLEKRNAWSVYLYAGGNCNTQTSQGGYSSFGDEPCTNIQSNSVDADTQGCTVILYADPGCVNPVHVFPQGDTCFSVVAPVPGAIQSFNVDC